MPCRIPCLFAAGMLLFSCAGKRAVSPGSASRPAADLPLPMNREPTVRLLIAEKFGGAVIEGGRSAAMVRVKVANGSIVLEEGKERRSASGFRLEPARPGSLRVDGKPFRGAVEVFINPLGDPVLVNEVEMEDYLRGVVPNELGPRSHPYLEALKAQAVAARTFAASNQGRFASLGFDLYADHRSQVYTGIAGEEHLSNRAVIETRGQTADYGGRPIIAMYSSTCGGMTAGYQDLFNASPVPYLPGGIRCRDSSSPYHEWDETIRLDSVGSTLDAYAGVGRLKRLVPGRHDKTGRLIEMTFEGADGSKTLRGVNLRHALGLRSNWILDLKATNDSRGLIQSLRVRGRGWGHGVGLCQYGAVEMAQSGAGYHSILKHYYPGIDVVKKY